MQKELQELYESLRRRRRPEDVADLILNVLDKQLKPAERKLLDTAARGALRRRVHAWTSMMEDFAKPVGMQRQVATARELFESAYPLTTDQCDDPDAVEAFIRAVCADVGKEFGQNDFKAHRLNREGRMAADLGEMSRRAYNKRFRLLARMEDRLGRLLRELRKRQYTMVGKSAFASMIDEQAFMADADSACFIAYYTARANLRSEFTISGQQRPYDEIADMLFRRCTRRGKRRTNWHAIAQVYPSAEVLAHLDDECKGRLLGQWFDLLGEIAGLLHETWSGSRLRRQTMIVARGNDSSTWNLTARAWNQARQHWIALLHALGMDDMLDRICPGKTVQLVAADVARWHRMTGGDLHPDTHVWAELPLPWNVLTGRATCTRERVETACRKHGVDPQKGGWTAPRQTTVAAFKPTPELVHGVTVSSPALAATLRKAGWFSGNGGRSARAVNEDVSVGRDKHGFALGAHPANGSRQ